MILLDSEMHEITEVSGDLDIEFGTSTDSTNDFVMSNGAFTGLQPYGFYEPGTEVGGIFEYSKNQSYSDITELHGYSWRGLLSQALILPPAGSDYKTVTGDRGFQVQCDLGHRHLRILSLRNIKKLSPSYADS